MPHNIANIDKSIYKPLAKGLSKLSKNKVDFLKVLVDMVYLDMEVYKDIEFDELRDILVSAYNLQKVCWDKSKEQFKCVCGHEHLKELNMMEYKNKGYILGSKCINRFKALTELDDNIEDIRISVDKWIELKRKLQFWINSKNRNSNKHSKINCIGCGEQNITPNYDYDDPRRTKWCPKCIKKKQTRCMEKDCSRMFYNPKNECLIRGEIWKKRCWTCYSLL